MEKTICLLPGDGIGPEILDQGALVMDAAVKKMGIPFIIPRG